MQCAAISRSWLILVEFYQNHSFQPREHAHLVQKTCSTSQTNKNHWNPRPIISLTERARRPISMPYTTFNIREGVVLRRHEIVHQACHFFVFCAHRILAPMLSTKCTQSCTSYPNGERVASGTRAHECDKTMGRRYDDMRATRLQRQWPASYVTLCVILPLVMILGGKQFFHFLAHFVTSLRR